MKIRNVMLMARYVSIAVSPYYLPLIALAALFTLSYLNQMPLLYKLMVLLIVYVFTVLLPTNLIRMYHRYHGWTLFELGSRERRMIPYIVSILCYFMCYYVMTLLHIPHLMGSIVVAALVTQIVCAVVNMWWKISSHMAVIGALGGGLAGFAEIFMFNPVWWLCLVFLLSGMVGSSLMLLRLHSLRQINYGFVTGALVGYLTVLLF